MCGFHESESDGTSDHHHHHHHDDRRTRFNPEPLPLHQAAIDRAAAPHLRHAGGSGADAGRVGPRHRLSPLSRRLFLGRFGKGTVALAVVTPVLAACGLTGNDDDSAAGTGSATDDADDGTTSADDATDSSDGTDSTADTDEEQAGADTLRWARTNLGFVSAYVLARGNTAAIVDTGTSGSDEAIGRSLADLGLNYSDVAHVILTHHHGDHVGSVDAVLANTPSANVYAGEADLGQINITAGGTPIDDSRIRALNGGEDVFGFEALATPGHTAGHMAAIDHDAGVLVAGDAIFTEGAAAIEGPERFFADVPESRRSIAMMAEMSFNTLLLGHGDPIESGADAAVAALAASLS
ncbi:MAG: MBL fold metallo-hydrolase [Actinomycetota bacterium]